MENLVEDCPYLVTSSIKRDFSRCRKKIDNISGTLCMSNNRGCSYWFEYEDDYTFFVISVAGNNPQKILTSERELMLGTMNYLVCGCGRQCRKLFLPSGETKLKCRVCHGLRYELSGINRTSPRGKILYRGNRTNKMFDLRANIKHIFYKSRFTHRYQSFLKLCERAGFHDLVEDSLYLMKAVQNQ